MIPYITIQKLSNRGPRYAVRLVGTQYAFDWNASLRCYAYRITSAEVANRLLEGIQNTRMLIPGFAFTDDSGKPLDTLEAAPKPEPQKSATVMPETPSAIAEPELAPRAVPAPAVEKVEPLADGEIVHQRITKRKLK